VAAQPSAPQGQGDLASQVQIIKDALANSKLFTSDPIEMVESNFRTEIATYTKDSMTIKDIHRLELGGKESSGSYTNLYTFKFSDMVADVPWKGFMNGLTMTLTCANGANCVKNDAGQGFPSVTLYVNRNLAAPVQKALLQILQTSGAKPPSKDAKTESPGASMGEHEH